MFDRSRLTGPFLISVGSLAFAVIALLTGGYAFISTVAASASGDADPAQLVATWIERHDEKMDLYTDRFNNRNVFYPTNPTPPPPPPPRPRQEPVVIVDEPPPPPREDPIPTTYGGPQLIAILGEEVWVRGSGANSIVRVAIGEEHQGVKLISTDPPWTAKLGWSRGEYDVPLFDNAVPGISEEAPTNTTASVPGIFNEGDIDPASLTRGISINATGYTPTRAATAGFGGRNVARPAANENSDPRSRRGRGARRDRDQEAEEQLTREREQMMRERETQAKREAMERAKRERDD